MYTYNTPGNKFHPWISTITNLQTKNLQVNNTAALVRIAGIWACQRLVLVDTLRSNWAWFPPKLIRQNPWWIHSIGKRVERISNSRIAFEIMIFSSIWNHALKSQQLLGGKNPWRWTGGVLISSVKPAKKKPPWQKITDTPSPQRMLPVTLRTTPVTWKPNIRSKISRNRQKTSWNPRRFVLIVCASLESFSCFLMIEIVFEALKCFVQRGSKICQWSLKFYKPSNVSSLGWDLPGTWWTSIDKLWEMAV